MNVGNQTVDVHH